MSKCILGCILCLLIDYHATPFGKSKKSFPQPPHLCNPYNFFLHVLSVVVRGVPEDPPIGEVPTAVQEGRVRQHIMAT